MPRLRRPKSREAQFPALGIDSASSIVNHKIEWRSRTCAYVYTLINVDTMLVTTGRYQHQLGRICQTYLAEDTQVHGYPTCAQTSQARQQITLTSLKL